MTSSSPSADLRRLENPFGGVVFRLLLSARAPAGAEGIWGRILAACEPFALNLIESRTEVEDQRVSQHGDGGSAPSSTWLSTRFSLGGLRRGVRSLLALAGDSRSLPAVTTVGGTVSGR